MGGNFTEQVDEKWNACNIVLIWTKIEAMFWSNVCAMIATAE